MKVLHFAGPSGQGKTRLIAALLPFLPAHLVIKWTHHPVALEKPGSDTQQFSAAGCSTLLIGPDGLVLRPVPANRPALYNQLARLLAHDTLVVVEGDKASPGPKIWLGGQAPGPVALTIGPDRPNEGEWMPAELPLSSGDVRRITAHLGTHWSQYTYTLSGGCHE